MKRKLHAYMNGAMVGTFEQEEAGRTFFRYADEWLEKARSGRSHPISVSLPFQEGNPAQDATAFVAGLLPDSVKHRELLAVELDIEDDPSDFSFLAKMGRDAAGALTILPPEEGRGDDRKPRIVPLTEAELAEHLRNLPRRPLLLDEDEGIMLSLAGMNDKTAVTVRKGKIGLPVDGFPSTHLVKVDIPSLPDSIRTEQFCLDLARQVGLRVPASEIRMAEDQCYMIMARYDRTIRNGSLARIHQEDFCQALGYMPGKKFERKGGPGWAACFDLLEMSRNPSEDREILLKQAVFQFLTGNPDAHAKNYSLVYKGESGGIRLSPIYDLNNAAAFRHHFKKARPIMAMAIGKQFNPDQVTMDDWMQFAQDCRLSPDVVQEELSDLAGKLLTALPVAAAMQAPCEAIDKAREDIRARCLTWGAQSVPVPLEAGQDARRIPEDDPQP